MQKIIELYRFYFDSRDRWVYLRIPETEYIEGTHTLSNFATNLMKKKYIFFDFAVLNIVFVNEERNVNLSAKLKSNCTFSHTKNYFYYEGQYERYLINIKEYVQTTRNFIVGFFKSFQETFPRKKCFQVLTSAFNTFYPTPTLNTTISCLFTINDISGFNWGFDKNKKEDRIMRLFLSSNASTNTDIFNITDAYNERFKVNINVCPKN